MKTPDEIKKGLGCCIEGWCSKCPYDQVCDGHMADGGDMIPAAEPLADFFALIQQQEQQLAEKDARIAELERERDAAVADLEKMGNARPYCGTCMYVDLTIEEEPCVNCHEGYFENHWQWRGVQEVE